LTQDIHGLRIIGPCMSWVCWCVMSLQVSIRQGESQESLLRRFQRMVQTSGILREAKAHRHFLSKGEAARLKAQKSARRRRSYQ
jgi:ribosomal protein S21